jgi:hypothetical protein
MNGKNQCVEKLPVAAIEGNVEKYLKVVILLRSKADYLGSFPARLSARFPLR